MTIGAVSVAITTNSRAITMAICKGRVIGVALGAVSVAIGTAHGN